MMTKQRFLSLSTAAATLFLPAVAVAAQANPIAEHGQTLADWVVGLGPLAMTGAAVMTAAGGFRHNSGLLYSGMAGTAAGTVWTFAPDVILGLVGQAQGLSVEALSHAPQALTGASIVSGLLG